MLGRTAGTLRLARHSKDDLNQSPTPYPLHPPGPCCVLLQAGYTPFLLGAFIGNIEMMAMLVKHDKTVIHDLHEKPAADGPYDFTVRLRLRLWQPCSRCCSAPTARLRV